jgi:hypothetical protein
MHVHNHVAPAVESSDAAELPAEIIRISAELFPGSLDVRWEADPELPKETFLVLTVHASGEPNELVNRRREWHRRVWRIAPEMQIRLSITHESS